MLWKGILLAGVVCWGLPAMACGQAQISGRVERSDTGAPIVGAEVEVYSSVGGGMAHRYSATTDSHGEFKFDGVADGDYAASAMADGFVSTHYPTQPGAAGGVTLSGAPLEPPAEAEPPAEHDPLAAILGERAGNWYTVPKHYGMVVKASSHLRLTFQLDPEAVIRGVVTDADGRPVGPGLRVEAVRARFVDQNNGGYFSYEQAAKTDAQGRFVLRPLSAESFCVRVFQSQDGNHPRMAGGRWYHEAWFGNVPTHVGAVAIPLKVGEERDDVRVVMQPERRYSLTIWVSGTGNGGKPLFLHTADAETAKQQPDGSYVMRDVSPGHYTLYVDGVRVAERKEIDVPEADSTLRLEVKER